jgi:hypothetical protein
MKHLNVTDIDCPNCGVKRGEWCRRHNETLAGATLVCVARSREVTQRNQIASATADTNTNNEGKRK